MYNKPSGLQVIFDIFLPWLHAERDKFDFIYIYPKRPDPKKMFMLQLSETSADDRGISARIGKPWTTGGDVPVDRLMWQAVCVVGRRLAGSQGSSSSSRSSDSSSSSSTCLPVIEKKNIIFRTLQVCRQLEIGHHLIYSPNPLTLKIH